MKIWVCIPVFNRVEYTLKCLASLYKQTYRDFCVVVCDHGSTDGTSEQIRNNYPDVVVLHESSELWWTGAINCCVKYALDAADTSLDAVLTLNNDLEVGEEYLNELAKIDQKYPGSIITSTEVDIKSGEVVSQGFIHSWITTKSRPIDKEKDSIDDGCVAKVTHAAGRGTLIPLSVFKRIGLYDEGRLPQYGADYDFSFRAARAGYEILVGFQAKVYSHVNETGLVQVHSKQGINALYQYLFSIRSPANLFTRWWLAWNNCPKVLFPGYMILDYLFVIGGFIKHRIKRSGA